MSLGFEERTGERILMELVRLRSLRPPFLWDEGASTAGRLVLRSQLDRALVGHSSPEFEVVASSIETVAARHA